MADLPGSRRVEHVMGMPIVIDVRDEEFDEEALDEAFAWFRRVDGLFSTYRDDSEIMRLARGELALSDADPDVQAVLARCEELRAETGGYFDARAAGPHALDPSGLVKGWSVDRAAADPRRVGPAQLRDQRGRRHAPARPRGARPGAGPSASSIRCSATPWRG